jgi:hypothetical protein
MAHAYFFQSGLNISGTQKVNYEDGESITFNLNYITSVADSVLWRFYKSDTKELIQSLTSRTPTMSFSSGIGKNGIDVELTVNWGIFTTKFYKRHRVVVMPDVSTPNYTINLSNAGTDPRIINEGANQYSLDFTGIPGGSIVRLMGSITAIRVKALNIGSNVNNPIILAITSPTSITKTGTTYDEALRIDDGAPTNGLWIYSRKASDGTRYFTINGGGISTFRTSNTSSHNNLRFTGILVKNAQSAGFKVKLDNVNRYLKNACEDCWIYDNEIDTATNEGTYCGWEASYGYRFDPTFNGGDYHHAMRRIKIFANYAHDCGWDSFQTTGAEEDSEIHDNLGVNNGTANQSSQDFGLQCGGGFAGQIYNNIFDRHIQVYASGDTYIYNNFIPGDVSQNGIFTKRYDNPGFVGPNGDSYNHSNPAGKLYIFNNIISSIQDPVYILDGNDDGSAIVPLSEIHFFNNTISWSGTPQEALGLRYNESGGTSTITLNNYIAPSVAAIKISNISTHDLSINPTSPVFTQANEGIDVSGKVTIDTLKVGLTDLSGQSYPVQGHFIRIPVQRSSGYQPPLTTEEQGQWYRTAQTSVFSDREKIPDMYGFTVKRYAYIGGSSKPRYLLAAKPRAKTGVVSGLEVIDDQSFL